MAQRVRQFLLRGGGWAIPWLTTARSLQVLVMLTTRKAIDLAKHERRDRRDARRTVGQADLERGVSGDTSVSVFSVLVHSKGPDPQFAAEVAEQCRHLLARLPDDQLRQIAVLKMEGYTGKEIAERLDVAPATVDRRLARIRQIWDGDRE